MSVNLKNIRSVILLMCVFLSAEAVAEIGRVCFTGRVGAKFDSLVRHRCTGAEARGMIYDETVKAFRTHFDDNHGSFDGWVTPEHGLWQGEYWGKNMLSLLAGAEYAGDETLKAFIGLKSARPQRYSATIQLRRFFADPLIRRLRQARYR